jgi:hypothetical protein
MHPFKPRDLHARRVDEDIAPKYRREPSPKRLPVRRFESLSAVESRHHDDIANLAFRCHKTGAKDKKMECFIPPVLA